MKIALKLTPKSTRNLTLNILFLICWRPWFWSTLQCFTCVFRFPPAVNSTRNTNKPSMENTLKKTCVFYKKTRILQKMTPKMCPKGWVRSRRLLFGASGGTFCAPVCFFVQKIPPKCPQVSPNLQKWLQKWPRNAKNDFKSAPEVSKSASQSESTRTSKSNSKNEPVWLQSLFVLHLARRTARSD